MNYVFLFIGMIAGFFIASVYFKLRLEKAKADLRMEESLVSTLHIRINELKRELAKYINARDL